MSNAANVSQDDRLINVDVLGAARRRKWIGIVIGALGVAGTVTVLNVWPSTYQSTSTILIEEPDVPADLVKATVSTFANDRLQVIQQRVMTSQHLLDIIKEFNLYPEQQQTMPKSALINLMRSNVDLALVSADISGQQPQQARQQPQASIAFTLSFSDQDPTIAQHVASRLTDLYLNENDRTRQERAAGTTEFLGEQSKKLYSDVQELEKRLLDLRSKYNGMLPEQFSMNTQLLNQAQSQLMMNQADLQSLMDKKSYLQSQLATISPYTPMTTNGVPATPQAQLMALELQYSDLSGRYGSKHPDVVRLQRQIEVMKQQIGGVDTRGVNEAKYSTLQAQLSDALQRYGEKHPEVQRLRRQLNELKAQMKSSSASSSAFTAPQGPPDNPMYIQTQNQLADVDAQIRGINERTNALQANITDLQKRILQTPTVEAEYTSLENQHQVALQRYQSFKDKEADAQVAQRMEQQSKGETFSVIEPAAFPDTPASPNRRLLMAVGFLMSAMLAAAAMIGIDMLDPRIYEPKSLMQAFGEMPLATVPYIRTSDELRGRRLRMIGAASIAVILMAGILAFGLPIF
jgi:protein tyrosine kinase modulator